MRTRTYSELRQLETFEERFAYLSLGGVVGTSTFGFDRWINQAFYRTPQWRRVRNEVILRDGGCDLGVPGYELHAQVLIHHMNPVERDDILDAEDWILDPEFLITTCIRTHNAIHYGNGDSLFRPFEARSQGDTKLW
jgi:hypothetical protein